MDKDLEFAEAKLQEAHALPENVFWKQAIIRQWALEIVELQRNARPSPFLS